MTAASVYADRRARVLARLDSIREDLEEHAARAAAHPESWGYPGDLGRVDELLAEVLEALGGPSR